MYLGKATPNSALEIKSSHGVPLRAWCHRCRLCPWRRTCCGSSVLPPWAAALCTRALRLCPLSLARSRLQPTGSTGSKVTRGGYLSKEASITKMIQQIPSARNPSQILWSTMTFTRHSNAPGISLPNAAAAFKWFGSFQPRQQVNTDHSTAQKWAGRRSP